MKLGKYAFDSKEQAEEKIKTLGVELNEDGVEVPTHPHAIIHLLFIAVEDAEYDDEGVITKEAVYSVKYSVDTAWRDITEHPEGWADYYVEVNGDGAHSIDGLNYQENKIK
tara:strand:+ start:633 stop:965 length:333 start_codon:yes stop_codon:yes gene_type:complete